MHPRQAIREAVVAALKAGPTIAGDSVYPTRTPHIRLSEIPLICVYTLSEGVDPESQTTAPRELQRQLELMVEAWVEPGPNIDDSMDDFAEQIEAAMHADPYFAAYTAGDIVGDSMLESTQLEAVVESDREIGFIAMTYRFTYFTDAPLPVDDSQLDDFETVGATYNLGNAVHVDDDAEDLFTVEESP